MPRLINSAPAYRRHRASGQAIVTLDGRDFYLGRHGTAASRAEYDRITGEWLANGRRLPAAAGGGCTVNELVAAFWKWAEANYRDADGQPTGEAENYRQSLRPLVRKYGPTAAADFGPLALKAVREDMVAADLCRTNVNRRVNRVRYAFRWGVENELVPAGVYDALKAVAPLKARKGAVRESEPIRPVPDAHVDAVLPHLPPTVRAMVELHRLTGMRSGELVLIRPADLDTGGVAWTYTPPRHKTAHHGHARKVYIGRAGQAVLVPMLPADLAAFVFSPARAVAERNAARRAARKTPVQPSQASRAKANPKRRPGARYTTATYYSAVLWGIRKAVKAGALAEGEAWHPHQLRHTFATRVRRDHGAEAAMVALGHRSLKVMEGYAEANVERAVAAVLSVG